MIPALLIAASLAAPAEVISTGSPVEQLKHPLAALSYPAVNQTQTGGGASGSLGGTVVQGGAWASGEYAGAAYGFGQPELLGPYLERQVNEAGIDAARLRPTAPVAVWLRSPALPWTWGATVRYAERDSVTNLDDALADSRTSRGTTVLLGVGRSFSPFRYDIAIGATRVRAEVDRAALGASLISHRETHESVLLANRFEWRDATGTWTPELRVLAGSADRQDAFYGAEAGVTWSGSLREDRVRLWLGAGYESFWGGVRHERYEMRQAAHLRIVQDHWLVATAAEALTTAGQTGFGKTLRGGYRYDSDVWSATVMADIEQFPAVVVVGAALKL